MKHLSALEKYFPYEYTTYISSQFLLSVFTSRWSLASLLRAAPLGQADDCQSAHNLILAPDFFLQQLLCLLVIPHLLLMFSHPAFSRLNDEPIQGLQFRHLSQK
jgi:hypothetical protein